MEKVERDCLIEIISISKDFLMIGRKIKRKNGKFILVMKDLSVAIASYFSRPKEKQIYNLEDADDFKISLPNPRHRTVKVIEKTLEGLRKVSLKSDAGKLELERLELCIIDLHLQLKNDSAPSLPGQ